MKLLFENWRKFLNERMEFGENFERWYHGESAGKIKCEPQSTMTDCLNEFGFTLIGAGSFRDAWALPDNPDYVLKVAASRSAEHHRSPKEMNKVEADTIIQTGYPELLPKVYDTADDYSWIVMERVKPYRQGDDSWVEDFFPAFNKLGEANQKNKDFAWRNSYPEEFFQEYTQARIDEIREKDDEDLVLTNELGGQPNRAALERELPPLYDRLLELLEQYDLAAWDVRSANVGKGADGRFVLLDLGWGLD